jgi:hypothetical protein
MFVLLFERQKVISLMIPDELKAYPQWVLWRSVAKPDGSYTKLPYCAASGGMASVTDPKTWSTYAYACEVAQRLICGIGFVLTDNDPFAFIDLDDPKGNQAIVARQVKIAQAFDTYQERSPSQTGLHIICKGAVQRGRRRDKVEVYSSGRYMTMTGETFANKPINDCGDLLRLLWDEIGGGPDTEQEVTETSQKYDDAIIHKMASEASNGDKFLQLWRGEYLQAGYPSQSEADFALINILGFYSRNIEQIKRMFYLSALGQRDKAKRRNYVDNMVKRSFDNQPPYIDLSQIEANAEKEIELRKTKSEAVSNPFAGPLFENVPDPSFDYTLPPGLLGEIAQYIYDSSPRQVREIALAASIGLMCGMCGRAYNVSSTGLNQYVLLLAKTGTGKEGMVSGIDRLLSEVQKQVPAAMEFIGPSAIASGQALIRHLSRIPCFVSIVGEFGLMLQSLCAFNANSSQIMLRKTLLELYMKSGKDEVLRSTIYSDKEKNTPVVGSPAFSILGESTPHAYYGGLDESMIAQGLLPRFLTIEYNGKVPYLNHSRSLVKPSLDLIAKIGDLATNCLTLHQNVRSIDVSIDIEAKTFAESFSRDTTDNINKADLSVVQELWNRAHLKMLKLAALVAVGTNAYTPVISLEMMQWSKLVVERDINAVLKQFESGYVGGEAHEMQQINKLNDIIKDYLVVFADNKAKRYNLNETMQRDRVLPLSYLQRRLLTNVAFKNDKRGGSYALTAAIQMLVTDGSIRPIREMDMHSRYNSTAKAWAIVEPHRFVD